MSPRWGATISAGIIDGLDRVRATRLSFFMAIPALTAAGLYEVRDPYPSVVGVAQMALGVALALVVACGTIAWLLSFVARHRNHTLFIRYRVALGIGLRIASRTGLRGAI